MALAALASLSFGLVLGPEAHVLALGATMAVWLTSRAQSGAQVRGLVGATDSAAAPSTLFGGPLIVGLIMLA